MRLFPLAPGFVVGLAACAIGTSPKEFLPATAPTGIGVTLLTSTGDDAKLVGELVSVNDSALVLAIPSTGLTLVGYRIITEGRFHQLGTVLRDGKAPTPEVRERLRLVSRYPQGMTPELTSALLVALGQPRLVVRP